MCNSLRGCLQEFNLSVLGLPLCCLLSHCLDDTVELVSLFIALVGTHELNDTKYYRNAGWTRHFGRFASMVTVLYWLSVAFYLQVSMIFCFDPGIGYLSPVGQYKIFFTSTSVHGAKSKWPKAILYKLHYIQCCMLINTSFQSNVYHLLCQSFLSFALQSSQFYRIAMFLHCPRATVQRKNGKSLCAHYSRLPCDGWGKFWVQASFFDIFQYTRWCLCDNGLTFRTRSSGMVVLNMRALQSQNSLFFTSVVELRSTSLWCSMFTKVFYHYSSPYPLSLQEGVLPIVAVVTTELANHYNFGIVMPMEFFWLFESAVKFFWGIFLLLIGSVISWCLSVHNLLLIVASPRSDFSHFTWHIAWFCLPHLLVSLSYSASLAGFFMFHWMSDPWLHLFSDIRRQQHICLVSGLAGGLLVNSSGTTTSLRIISVLLLKAYSISLAAFGVPR